LLIFEKSSGPQLYQKLAGGSCYLLLIVAFVFWPAKYPREYPTISTGGAFDEPIK